VTCGNFHNSKTNCDTAGNPHYWSMQCACLKADVMNVSFAFVPTFYYYALCMQYCHILRCLIDVCILLVH
jgi:hypothetical protein